MKARRTVGILTCSAALCGLVLSPYTASAPYAPATGALYAYADTDDASSDTAADGSGDGSAADASTDKGSASDTASKKSSKKTAKKSSKESKSSVKASDAKDVDEEDASKQKLTEEEKASVSTAKSKIAEADKEVGGFSSATSELEQAQQKLAELRVALDDAKEDRDAYQEKISSQEQEREDAKTKLSDVQRQLDELGNTNVFSLIMRQASYSSLKRQALNLKDLIAQADENLQAMNSKLAGKDAYLASLEKKVKKAEKKILKFVEQTNSSAYKLESSDSVSRQADSSAQDAVAELSSEKEEAAEAITSIGTSLQSHEASRSEARSTLEEWYAAVNDLSGLESSLSFGEGADFALTEDEFVEKWGTAIDKFYEQWGQTAGFTPPLKGQGATMAKFAYEYKIDPRLCAAVSIAESSGGQYCIKSCNAWGWGAADSDPSGLAASWGSWEEAIEAWHKGMAESTSGLAEAGCISALGQIYCSTPHWASVIAEQVEAISEIAQTL